MGRTRGACGSGSLRSLARWRDDSLAGGMPLYGQGTAGGSSRATQGRRPGAPLPGPAPPGPRWWQVARLPRARPPGAGMVRAAVTCPVTAMAGPGRRPPAPAARCAGPAEARSRSGGDGPSGLGPVRLRLMSDRAVTGAGRSRRPVPRGCRGARDLTGPPRAPPELSPWPSGVARWAVSCPLRAAVSPHRPSEPCPDFFELGRSSWRGLHL